jgi:uncharacterized protein
MKTFSTSSVNGHPLRRSRAFLLARRRIRLLGLTAAAAAIAVSSPAVASAQVAPANPEPFVLVNGFGQVRVKTDRARINFAVVTEATTAADAAAKNATQMDAVMRALRGTGIAGLQIESWGYNLSPRYSVNRNQPNDGEPRIVGYTASNNVRVTVDDVSAVGKLIDSGVTGGANQVTSLQFEAKNTDTPKAEALRMAVQNARMQAETMATAMGLTLGPALEVTGGSESPAPPPMPYMDRMAAMSMAAPETSIVAADQTVSAHVTIKFALRGN